MSSNRKIPDPIDQAEQLRQLAQQSLQPSIASQQSLPRPAADSLSFSGPQVILVAGAKGGVGATSVGLWMAAAISRFRSHPIVVIDANPYSSDIWLHRDWHRGGFDRHRKIDLWQHVSSSGNLEYAFHSVTDQIWVAGGIRPLVESSHHPQRLIQQLLRQLSTLRGKWPVVILVGGGGIRGWDDAYWKVADRIMLVSSPQVDSVLAAYHVIKSQVNRSLSQRIGVTVNGGEDKSHALDAGNRLEHACRRCLRLQVEPLAWIPTLPYNPLSEQGIDGAAQRMQRFNSIFPQHSTETLANWLQSSDESGIFYAPKSRETA